MCASCWAVDYAAMETAFERTEARLWAALREYAPGWMVARFPEETHVEE